MNIEFEISIKDLLKQFGGGLPDIVDYQYYKNLEKRRIIINEDISDTLLETAILPLIDMDNDGSGKPITKNVQKAHSFRYGMNSIKV